MTPRLRRSELATPASNEHMVERAVASAADLTFLDLEDAVAPDDKVRARGIAIAALSELDWGATTRAVRVNAIGSSWILDDVLEIVGRAGDAVEVLIVPKVKSARDVRFVETLLEHAERRAGVERPIALEVLVEEVEALAGIDAIACASRRLEAVILGFGDLAASQGVPFEAIGGSPDYPGDLWHYARARTVIAARCAGVAAIDGPFPDIRDLDGYRRQCAAARTLGFAGKWAIHPAQIEHANAAFSPTDAEIARARRVSDAYEAATARGDGAVAVDGMLVDAAVLRMTENTLARAQAIADR
jgi:citrate lyase subunit beta/citryl-CoA lyase